MITVGPRVLVVGGHIEDNQFTRRVKDLGCTVDWHDGRPGKSFPHFADALVCAKFQLSHEGFWAAKSAYKGKPIFIADHSWSTIKERFETFVMDWKLINKPKTAIAVAMQQAIVKEDLVKKSTNPFMAAVQAKGNYPPDIKRKIFTLIASGTNEGLNAIEIANRLKMANISRADGQPFSNSDVHNWRSRKSYEKYIGKPAAVKNVTIEIEAKQSAIPAIAKAPKQQSDKLVYELILSAGLGPVETTGLMRRCMDGKLTQNEALKFIELYTDLKKGD